jgi:hypothetical protein
MSAFGQAEFLATQNLHNEIVAGSCEAILNCIQDPNLNLNLRGENGLTLPMLAIMTGNPEIAQAVFSAFNIDFSVADEANDTIKEYASKSNNSEIIQIVQYMALPPEVKLHMACSAENRGEVFYLLTNPNLDINF